MAAQAARLKLCSCLCTVNVPRLSYGLKRTLFTTSSCAVAHVYHVTVKTGDVFGAGTDANVYVRMIGEKGSTDEIKLNAKKEDMERGMRNTYKIFAEDVGRLDKLIIRHDNTGLGPAWYLDNVNIRDRRGQSYEFECRDWLLRGADDQTAKLLHERNHVGVLSEEPADIDNDIIDIRYDNFDGKPDVISSSSVTLESRDEPHGKSLENVMRNIVKDNRDEVVEVVFNKEDELHHDYVMMDADSDIKEADKSSTEKQHSVNKPIHEPSKKHSKLLSPAVRALLYTYDLQLYHVAPSGPHSRVLKGDVLAYLRTENIKEKKKFVYVPPDFVATRPVKKQVPIEEKIMQKSPAIATRVTPPRTNAFYIDHQTNETQRNTADVFTTNKYNTPHSYFSQKCSVENFYQSVKTLNTMYSIDSTGIVLVRLLTRALDKCGVLADLNVRADVLLQSSLQGSKVFTNCLAYDLEDLMVNYETAGEDANHTSPFGLSIPEPQGVVFTSTILPPGMIISASFSGTQLTVNSIGKLEKSSVVSFTCDASIVSEEKIAKCLDLFVKYIEQPVASSL